MLKITKELCDDACALLNAERDKTSSDSFLQALIAQTDGVDQESVGALLQFCFSNQGAFRTAAMAEVGRYQQQHPGVGLGTALELLHLQLIVRACLYVCNMAHDRDTLESTIDWSSLE